MTTTNIARPFESFSAYRARTGKQLPVVKCPNYWECGDYATEVRAGRKPGKVQLLCPYHARKVEREESAE